MFKDKLKSLNIESSYDSKKDVLKYTIHVPHEDFRDNRQKNRYFEKVVHRIGRDAEKRDGLENLALSIDRDAVEGLRTAAASRLELAKEHKTFMKNPDKVSTTLQVVGGVSGVIGSLTYFYPPIAEAAFNSAEYINNNTIMGIDPPYSSPIAGLTQLGISVGGAALTVLAGAIIGVVGSGIIGFPINIYRGFHSVNVDMYEKILNSLAPEEIILDRDPDRVRII